MNGDRVESIIHRHARDVQGSHDRPHISDPRGPIDVPVSGVINVGSTDHLAPRDDSAKSLVCHDSWRSALSTEEWQVRPPSVVELPQCRSAQGPPLPRGGTSPVGPPLPRGETVQGTRPFALRQGVPRRMAGCLPSRPSPRPRCRNSGAEEVAAWT